MSEAEKCDGHDYERPPRQTANRNLTVTNGRKRNSGAIG